MMITKLDEPLGVFHYELLPINGRLEEQVLKLVEVAEWPGWTFGYSTLRPPRSSATTQSFNREWVSSRQRARR